MDSTDYQKVEDFIFVYKYRDRNFLIQTYPFKIYQLPKMINKNFVKEFIKDNRVKSKSPTIEPTKYYLPLFIGTTYCNFKCKYCYAHQGSYGERPLNMSKKVIRATFDFLYKKMNKLAENSLKKEIEVGVVFFGGEPLLNFEGLRYLTKKLSQVVSKLNKNTKTKFRPLIILNTNGSLFTKEIISFLKKHKEIFELVISFDGLHHDKYRIFQNGKPTLKKVTGGIKRIKKLGFKYSLTCCEPPNEIEKVDKNVKFITSLFGKDVEINFSFIRGAIPCVKRKASYPGILEAEYTNKSLSIFGEKVARLVEEGYCIYKNRFLSRLREGGYLWRCPASLFEFCVYVNGDVYPCHNFIDSDFKLGNILDKNFKPGKQKEIINKFKARTINKAPCGNCLYQTVCLSSFDCPSHSYYDLGNLYLVDKRTCIAAKKIMKALFDDLLDNLINKNKKK